MIKLRPHHILCIQNYKGKGYDNEFIKNMDNVIEWIKNENKIKITFGIDNICCKCPNKKKNNKCITNEKVVEIDKKVIKYFKIEERVYNYLELNNYVIENLTKEIQKDICGNCEWYIKKICFNKE